MQSTIKVVCRTHYRSLDYSNHFIVGNYYDVKLLSSKVICIFETEKALIQNRPWIFPIHVADIYFDLTRLKKLISFI